MTRRLAAALLAVALGVGAMTQGAGATGAPVGKPPVGLTVQITSFGLSIAGTVKLAYTVNHHATHKSCSILRCLFTIPHGAVINVTQTAHRGTRFVLWALTKQGTHQKPRTIRKPGFLLVANHTYLIQAVYKKG